MREAFPALHRRDGRRARVYFDNPAGTQVPERVADAVRRCMLECNANLGGFFATSRLAEEVVDRAHEARARFLGASAVREIVGGPSMTALAYAITRSGARTLRPGDEIGLTRMEHDANVAPWLTMAQECGAVVRWLEFDRERWTIDPAALDAVLTNKTRWLALNGASNLTGSINDVRALTQRAHAAGARVFVDAVQLAPHVGIDVRAIGCDMLACSPYKFFGPHLGVCWGDEALLRDLQPYKVRPASDALPWRFETGTPQIELQAGLLACIEYFEWLGGTIVPGATERAAIEAAFAGTRAYEAALARRTIDGLLALPGVNVHGIVDAARADERVPTISFTHARRSPDEIARALGDVGVFVWSGHNFALEVVRHLGIDERSGVVRVGLAHYNTAKEVDRALAVLAKALG